MAPQQPQYHVFSLPRELLINLTLRNLISQESSASPQLIESQSIPSSTTATRACNICPGASFIDVDNQRSHFRTDWHRYNIKARLSNKKAVTEVDFATLVDSLDDSLSGSGSESEEVEFSSESDAVQTLWAKSQGEVFRSTSPNRQAIAPQTALTWFHSPPSTQIGLYRSLFMTSTQPDQYVEELRAMQNGGKKGRRWAMFMVAGGHFAGVVVRVSKGEDQDGVAITKAGQKKVVPDMEILRHKTFHRYTTRRKQGGSQSLNDNAKGNAKSAGALLRRYGEQALREDIRNLITEWSDDIADCELIWLRASGANKRIFWDYDDAVILKGDKRLRSIPFPTRRPTQSELSRCLMELTRIKMTHFTEGELKAQDELYLASLPKVGPSRPIPIPETKVPSKEIPKLTKEEVLLRDKWFRFIEMIKKGRLDAAKGFWERENNSLGVIDVTIPEWADEKVGTFLQLAALSGQKDIVEWLLDDLRADPTLPVPSIKTLDEAKNMSDNNDAALQAANVTLKRAYDLAPDRATRDVFRRSADIHPDWWDWFGTAHVPSGLNKEMEEERDNKLKIRRKGLKDKLRDREAREKEKEREIEEREEKERKEKEALRIKEQLNANVSGPRKLGGTNEKNTAESNAGLTPEMRARIERERRARAAEARLKAMSGR